MTKKSIICVLAIIILSLCCGMCFAEESSNSINLGNEIMESVDKTGDSFQNIISGNIMDNSSNMMKDGENDVKDGMRDMGTKINNGESVVGDYNVTRTASEGTNNNNNGAMTTTTWMWIILAVAAVIIIAAIWYYATQNNS